MQHLRDVARKLEMALCFGYAERVGEDGMKDYEGPVYNSAICIDSDGSIAGHYRKSHLWHSEERRRFSEGHELIDPPFTLRGHPAHRFVMLICYDIEYPEAARLAALKGSTVLLVMSGHGGHRLHRPHPHLRRSHQGTGGQPRRAAHGALHHLGFISLSPCPSCALRCGRTMCGCCTPTCRGVGRKIRTIRRPRLRRQVPRTVRHLRPGWDGDRAGDLHTLPPGGRPQAAPV